MAVFDDGSGAALFAGGTFKAAGGVTVNNIAKWDGTGWSALIGSSGTGVSIYAPAVYDGGLYASFAHSAKTPNLTTSSAPRDENW